VSKAAGRRRLDAELVRRGLAESRQQAQAAIAAGRVLVRGALADRASRLVDPSEPVVVAGPPPRFVSRGGEKLNAALERFAVDVDGLTALDAGASTGGFTDCLLQRGAARVVALDVGHGQLDSRLRADPRVVVVERTNIRHLDPAALERLAPGVSPFDVVVADLSFISLRAVAPVLAGPLLRQGGHLLVLVKPQFEVGKAAVSRGRGVIRDPQLWSEALDAVASSFAAGGAAIMGAMPSPLLGASGNTEFVLHLVAGGIGAGAPPGIPAGAILEQAVREASVRAPAADHPEEI
jgi:23S rRNA (cytidine1920-2'-O)/16S rRNA (cytidine1409-2'-O)-methyltransferase